MSIFTSYIRQTKKWYKRARKFICHEVCVAASFCNFTSSSLISHSFLAASSSIAWLDGSNSWQSLAKISKNKLYKVKKNKTRLHSSRMRTARPLTVSPSMLCAGGAWSGGHLVPGGGLVRGGPGSEGVACHHALRQTPRVNGMTDGCKNITLPQTSFAGGN